MRNFSENYSLVRILHAVVEGDVVDVHLNGSPFANNVRFTEFTPYIYVPKGKYTVEVFQRDEKENPIIKGVIDITSCELMTIAISGENDKNIEIIPIEEEMTIPEGNKSKARFIYLVPNGRPIDIVLDEQTVLENVVYKDITPYMDIDPKTYQVDVLLNENSQLIRQIRVTINPGRVYSFYALGNKPNFQIFQSLDGATCMK